MPRHPLTHATGYAGLVGGTCPRLDALGTPLDLIGDVICETGKSVGCLTSRWKDRDQVVNLALDESRFWPARRALASITSKDRVFESISINDPFSDLDNTPEVAEARCNPERYRGLNLGANPAKRLSDALSRILVGIPGIERNLNDKGRCQRIVNQDVRPRRGARKNSSAILLDYIGT